jgi:hypothetical protein
VKLEIDMLPYRPNPMVDWTDSPLPSTFTLRHLSVSRLSLSAAFVRGLLSMPFESLSFDGCEMQASDDNAVINAEQAVGNSSAALRLVLPSCEDGARMLQLYVKATQRTGCGLQELDCCGELRPEQLCLIAYLQQLRILHLRRCTVNLSLGPACDLSPLMTASGTPRLPHLTELSLPMLGSYTDVPCQSELIQAFANASQQLTVTAYSAQLTSLSVTVVSSSTLGSWVRLLFLRCHHLRDLCIEATRRECTEQPVELQAEPEPTEDVRQLPSLRKLTLNNLPLTGASLLSLLSRCPELETCVLWFLSM